MSNKGMSFKVLNKRLSLCTGLGKWLQWVKDPALKTLSVYQVFQRSAGVTRCVGRSFAYVAHFA